MPRTSGGESGRLPDLTGAGVGRYQVEDCLGTGPGGAVYRALERGEGRHVALKVLDPARSALPGFVARLVEDTTRIAALRHPRVNPVYDVGTHAGLVYVGMRLVRGGTLEDHLRLRRLDQDSALRILHEVAAAVESAHEAGVVHGSLKASNVLLDTDGSACVTDFGLGPARSGSQVDVQALAALLDEMLGRGAVAGGRGSGSSVRDLLGGLDLSSWSLPSLEAADQQLRALLDASFDAAFAVDRDGAVLHWNARAERLLMRPAEAMVGRPLLRSLIVPRHRELLERELLTVAAAGGSGLEGRPVEVFAVRGDGAQRTLEASIAPLRFGRGLGGAVVFCRDVTPPIVPAAAEAPAPAGDRLRAVLERECTRLGLPAAAVWVLTDDRLGARCEAFWHRPAVRTAELEMLSQGVQRVSHLGPAGASAASGRGGWTRLGGAAPEARRSGAARRAGLVATGTAPLLGASGRTLGALEVFASGESTPPVAELEEVARAVTPLLRLAGAEAATQRFALDPASSMLGFSCAFMKLLTVHGTFGDFSGWMEITDEDPSTIRARCVIKSASVETGSLDRNFHLRSGDFFNVERFPELVFDVTRVGSLGDQSFRVLGELRIRDVVRPVRLDARLEDTEMEGDRVSRMTLTGSAVINRQDWFLDWERALQAGRWVVGDWIRLDLVLTLVRSGDA